MCMHAHRYGQCLPYIRDLRNVDTPCDVFYEIDVDRVFLPNGRALNNLDLLTKYVADAKAIGYIIEEPCR